MNAINFRPHHFLCTLCFKGKGYSPNFIRNYKKIFAQLNSEGGDQTKITVVNHTDSICSPCPHKRELACASQEKITSLDNGHAAVLELQTGETLTWQAAKQRIKDKMTLEKFHHICEPCSWKAYGLCEETLRLLHADGENTDLEI